MGKILICGDYAPTRSNEDALIRGVVQECIGDQLAELFEKEDFIVLNLETSVTSIITPKKKRGQLNTAKPETCTFLKNAGVDLCCMANNHVIDNDAEGVIRTCEVLDEYKIRHIGAGPNSKAAAVPYQMKIDGKAVKFLNFANNEFNEADESTPGVNVFDPFVSFDNVRSEKNFDELLIVIYHGGIEYYQYPTPELQRICRKFVDCGADYVLCQHSHCIGAYEEYASGKIVYGQGNFLFDDSNHYLERNSILVEIDTETNQMRLIPVVKNGSTVRLAKETEKEEIITEIMKRSEEIHDEKRVETLFRRFVQAQQSEMFKVLMGYNKVYKLVNKITRGKLERIIYTSKAKMRILNILQSPAHLEVLKEALNDE